MNSEINQYYINRIDQLDILIKKAEKGIESLHKGRLRVSAHKGIPQYYIKESDQSAGNGTYIKKHQRTLARELAQREYLEKILPMLKEEQEYLSRILEEEPKINFEECYANLIPGRQALVTPLYETDEMFIARWLKKYPGSMNPYPIKDIQYTQRDEEVRSKSEALIANALLHHNVPYAYESELKLKNHIIYPDFTCLNVRTRKTWRWEHLGRMAFSEYARENCDRIDEYALNGIFLGDGLIITTEHDGRGLNGRVVEALINKHLV